MPAYLYPSLVAKMSRITLLRKSSSVITKLDSASVSVQEALRLVAYIVEDGAGRRADSQSETTLPYSSFAKTLNVIPGT